MSAELLPPHNVTCGGSAYQSWTDDLLIAKFLCWGSGHWPGSNTCLYPHYLYVCVMLFDMGNWPRRQHGRGLERKGVIDVWVWPNSWCRAAIPKPTQNTSTEYSIQ